MEREIDHFEVCDGKIYVLSDDGLLFEMGSNGHWVCHPPLPQPPEGPSNGAADEDRGETMLGIVIIFVLAVAIGYWLFH